MSVDSLGASCREPSGSYVSFLASRNPAIGHLQVPTSLVKYFVVPVSWKKIKKPLGRVSPAWVPNEAAPNGLLGYLGFLSNSGGRPPATWLASCLPPFRAVLL